MLKKQTKKVATWTRNGLEMGICASKNKTGVRSKGAEKVQQTVKSARITTINKAFRYIDN